MWKLRQATFVIQIFCREKEKKKKSQLQSYLRYTQTQKNLDDNCKASCITRETQKITIYVKVDEDDS